MINHQYKATPFIASPRDDSVDRVAVLLAGYGEVESFRDLSVYNQAASKYIAAQFLPIPDWLYPLAGKILALQDLYNFGVKHHQFVSPENEIFEKQRVGIEKQLQNRWGNRVEVFEGFYFCQPFVQEVVANIIHQGFENLLIYPLLVVDSAFTGAIAIEQVNEVIAATAQADCPQNSPFKSIRYIRSFATEPDYIDLMVHQLEETLTQPDINCFFESRIGIVLTVHGGPEKATASSDGGVFQPELLTDIPPLARRYLENAIAPGTPLASAVRFWMHGKKWHSFKGEEVIYWNRGMIWRATTWMQGLLIWGSDRIVDGVGKMQWKILGLFPVMQGSGEDLTRSAVGRVQVESMLLPSVLCNPDISWIELNSSQVQANFTALGEPAKLTLTINDQGMLEQAKIDRWGNLEGEAFHYIDFGGMVEDSRTFDGYTIPTRLCVGWYFGSDRVCLLGCSQ